MTGPELAVYYHENLGAIVLYTAIGAVGLIALSLYRLRQLVRKGAR